MKYSYKQIWLINQPILVSLLMEQLINLTDSIFLGHFSPIDLGASALAAMYYSAIHILGFGFSLGAQVVIARRSGEGAYAATGKIFYQALIFLSAFSVFVSHGSGQPHAQCKSIYGNESIERYSIRPIYDPFSSTRSFDAVCK